MIFSSPAAKAANAFKRAAKEKGRLTLSRAPEGFDGLVLSEILNARGGRALFIARDDRRAEAVASAVRFFGPGLEIVRLPGWDCQPYDRVSPSASLAAARTAALRRLAQEDTGPVLIVTTVGGVLQRAAPRSAVTAAAFSARAGQVVDTDALKRHLLTNGYTHAATVEIGRAHV